MTRFIHAADIHLDSPLRGLARYEGAPVERLRNATRGAFEGLISYAIDESVDFMVIAGDLYDGAWRDANTGLYFSAQMGRLRQAGIRCVLLYGNHDAASEITRTLSLPDNVQVFGHRRAETITFNDLGVALHGHSFKQADTPESLHEGYPAPSSGLLNIGVLHTALEGHAEHARYAPCTTQSLVAKGYQYWALGHVHERRILNEEPWIVFPGNLQGRHAKETGARGAVMVTADGPDIRSVEQFDCDVLLWHVLQIDIDGLDEYDELLIAVDRAMETACSTLDRPVAARIELHGRTGLHGELSLGLKSLRDDILSRANGLGEDRIWVEKVKLLTSPPASSKEIASREDALADLATMLAAAPDDPELLDDVKRELEVLRDTLPDDMRTLDVLPELEGLDEAKLAELIRNSGDDLINRLAGG